MENIRSAPTDHVYRQLDVPEYVEKHIMMFSGETSSVRLRCASRFASDVLDQFGSSVIMLQSNEEYFDCSVRVVVSRLLFSWLMRYGNGIKILGPGNVIEQFREACRETLRQYEE